MEQFKKMEPVDDILWMSKATCELVLGHLQAKLTRPLEPGKEYLILDALCGVQIHLDETLALRVVESGTYERYTSTGFPREKIVRHRYTI